MLPGTSFCFAGNEAVFVLIPRAVITVCATGRLTSAHFQLTTRNTFHRTASSLFLALRLKFRLRNRAVSLCRRACSTVSTKLARLLRQHLGAPCPRPTRCLVAQD